MEVRIVIKTCLCPLQEHQTKGYVSLEQFKMALYTIGIVVVVVVVIVAVATRTLKTKFNFLSKFSMSRS